MTVQATQSIPAAGLEALSDALCDVDGSRLGYEAVAQAAELVGAQGRLTLLAVTDVHNAGRYATAAITPERARRALAHAAKLAAAAGVAARCEIDEHGPVTDVLLARARDHRLLAVPAPSMSRKAHVLLGGAPSAAVHRLPASTLVARRPPREARFLDRIVVASDALEGSDALLEFAAALASRHGSSSLTLVHASHGESTQHPTRVARQLDRIGELLGERGSVRVAPGRPHELIVETATDERASLVIVGSRRLAGLRALGSVSERVAHDAPCSVLVLRTEDRSS